MSKRDVLGAARAAVIGASRSPVWRLRTAAGRIGDGYGFVERVCKYACARAGFERPIGMNQGVQFPIADAYIEIEATNLMRFEAARHFDVHEPCGAQADVAKFLAAKSSREAADVCLQTHGGFGLATKDDIGRRLRETRLYPVAPLSTNLIHTCIARHVPGLPRAF